jgi:hypothetical protein
MKFFLFSFFALLDPDAGYGSTDLIELPLLPTRITGISDRWSQIISNLEQAALLALCELPLEKKVLN